MPIIILLVVAFVAFLLVRRVGEKRVFAGVIVDKIDPTKPLVESVVSLAEVQRAPVQIFQTGTVDGKLQDVNGELVFLITCIIPLGLNLPPVLIQQRWNVGKPELHENPEPTRFLLTEIPSKVWLLVRVGV